MTSKLKEISETVTHLKKAEEEDGFCHFME
jgi:hypothetical protein